MRALVPALLAVVPAPQAPAAAPLEAALARVSTEAIRADVCFIASDELGGRDTPSPGLRHAARFVRARLQRLGFEPGGAGGSFFHEYELHESRLDPAATEAWIETGEASERLRFAEDYYFFPGGIATLDLRAPVAFAGTSAAGELEGVDLAGRWALVFQSDGVSWRERERNARERGAVGLIVTTAPGEEDVIGKAAAARGAQALRGTVGSGGTGGTRTEVFPHLYLSARRAHALFGGKAPPAVGTELPGAFRDVRAPTKDSTVHVLENVCGFWRGRDPELRKEVILVSAHYDHVGTRDGEVYNGADDNGSGTVGLLALAEALQAYGPMRRSVMLLWLSGEEKRLLGSDAWTRDPTLPEGYRALCDLNIDMIGRNAPDYLLITPTSARPEYNGLVRLAEANAPAEGFPELGSCDQFWSRSDHASFSRNLGIPVAFLFSDVHEDYHQPTDTPDKLDCDKVRRVVRLIVRMLDGLQADDLDL